MRLPIGSDKQTFFVKLKKGAVSILVAVRSGRVWRRETGEDEEDQSYAYENRIELLGFGGRTKRNISYMLYFIVP